jgi:DNA-binding transcriptional LysR family regulator
MKIRGLNLNSLLVFSGVYRSASMTLAAQEMGMTQPGVTQHIKNLEALLNVELFHRTGKKLIPSKSAEVLYEGLNESLENIETLLSNISQKDRQFTGNVRIGVPIEFGNTMVLPNLSRIRRQFPQVQFHITYGLAHELNSLIMEGKLDFAFTDQYQMNPAIKSEVVYHENLILCCSKEYFDLVSAPKKDRAFFESLSYVDYQSGEPILRDWFERAFGFKKMKLPIATYSFDVQGIATLVTHSMGVGVLPEHVFTKLKDNGVALYQFRPKKGPVNNPISLSYLEQRWQVPLNQFVITVLKDWIMKR